MATPVPTPPPRLPEPSVAEKARASIAAVKTKGDVLRPFRYVYNFTAGTIRGGLDGIANWGRHGLAIGLSAGIFAAIAVGGLAPLFGFAMGGFVAAAVVGGAKGFLTGGYKAMARQHRGEVYAEDLVERAKIQERAGPNRSDYRHYVRYKKAIEGANQFQFLERQNELTRDTNTYWRDQVNANANNPDRGMGF